MASLLYHLAANPEQQERLRNEIVGLLPHVDSPIDNVNFEQFSYLRACLKESIRLQPQVPGNIRGAGRSVILNGYQIPSGVSSTLYLTYNWQ